MSDCGSDSDLETPRRKTDECHKVLIITNNNYGHIRAILNSEEDEAEQCQGYDGDK